MSTRKQLSLLLAALIGGTSLVAIVAVSVVFLIRVEIVRLSRETSPTQVKLAKLQRGFERISGAFARISAASSEEELSAVESELGQTMTEVESISRDLSAGTAVIQNMQRTGAELRRMARERIEARKQVAEANRNVGREMEAATAAARKLSDAMTRLQKSSQDTLVSSRKSDLDANSGIKALLVVRQKIEQLRSAVQEVRIVDKKFSLNVLRDKAAGVVDGMASQDVADPALAAKLKSFAEGFGGTFGGDAGLLAARAAVIGAPQDAKLRAAYDDRQKAVTTAIDELSTQISNAIDPLELAVRKANTGMNQATDLIGRVAAVSSAASEVNARARSMQALAWQLLSASNNASVDAAAVEIESQAMGAARSLAGLREGLSGPEHAADRAAVESARQSFARVRELLASVASAVRQGISKQQQAEQLFSSALDSIRQVALAGSNRARDAEGAQEQAVSRIRNLAAATFILVGVVACGALAAGSGVGRRVRKDILASEERHVHDVTGMRRVVQRMTDGARTLRITSRSLTETSDLVARNIATIAGGADHMQSSIHSIAASASEASSVGGVAASLVESTATAVASLRNASIEIGKVTEVIRSIAFSTKLLALNAAIEAAHAKEAGAGFAVVAAEVKNLAAAATRSTTDIDSRVATMEAHVNKVTGNMSEISSIIGRIRGVQDAISVAVQEQTATTGRIAASIRETGSSGQGMHALALQLSTLAQDLETVTSSSPPASPLALPAAPVSPPQIQSLPAVRDTPPRSARGRRARKAQACAATSGRRSPSPNGRR